VLKTFLACVTTLSEALWTQLGSMEGNGGGVNMELSVPS